MTGEPKTTWSDPGPPSSQSPLLTRVSPFSAQESSHQLGGGAGAGDGGEGGGGSNGGGDGSGDGCGDGSGDVGGESGGEAEVPQVMRTSAAAGRVVPTPTLTLKLRQQPGDCTSSKVNLSLGARGGVYPPAAQSRRRPWLAKRTLWSGARFRDWPSYSPARATSECAPKSTVTVLPTSQPSTKTSNDRGTSVLERFESQALRFSSAQPSAADEKMCAGGGGSRGGSGTGDGGRSGTGGGGRSGTGDGGRSGTGTGTLRPRIASISKVKMRQSPGMMSARGSPRSP